jgi:hypothetical protein
MVQKTELECSEMKVRKFCKGVIYGHGAHIATSFVLVVVGIYEIVLLDIGDPCKRRQA